ncbi:MAG: alpha-amylase family glycosyl hydrolase [Lachnospiraceae bacterium]|nr:alpha-amylase family glycosyl hydrolase [Lachnospiraceae bacterium]MCM1239763.1 alpha-amylase family glycosyl hydrolase [Lachnospiraceae bacterium]
MTKTRTQQNPYPLGAHVEAGRIRFAYATKAASCGVILYDRKTGKQLRKEAFSAGEKIGNVYCKCIDGLRADQISYQFYEDDRKLPDPFGRSFESRKGYGKSKNTCDLKTLIPTAEFDWEGDVSPRLGYPESVGYCIHVRGFTAHASSRVAFKGTYRGIMEKIPYLKETGITTLELQPSYEFLELEPENDPVTNYCPQPKEREPRLNYWGYKEGYYYAPKAGYAAGEDAVTEFKELVKALHKNGMELVMQFYFPKGVRAASIPEILRFWVLEYHVDGFHLMGTDLQVEVAASDPLLADTKLWYYYFNTDVIYSRDEAPDAPNLACYQDDYLYTLRRFLKGDENMLENVMYQMRRIPPKMGRVHYLTNYCGFTMMDMVSYDYKHNEANGEENRDGTNYNCSWNCGEEGNSRKQKIRELRQRQIRNAYTMLLCTQSMPLIFMGDEFGNSQRGNNNPYCQDNATTWLDWRDLQKHRELYDFWKQLVRFRQAHPILRREQEAKLMDHLSCGYPDLSYHGKNAWRAQMESYNRHIGILYCGKYAVRPDGSEDDFLYLAMNMHWESHELALPKLPKGMKWERVFATGEETAAEEEYIRRLPPRSTAIYCSVKEQEKTVRRKSRRNG